MACPGTERFPHVSREGLRRCDCSLGWLHPAKPHPSSEASLPHCFFLDASILTILARSFLNEAQTPWLPHMVFLGMQPELPGILGHRH